jgi:hypothetical protein
MSTTNGTGDDRHGPRWDDSGAITVITWSDESGHVGQLEVASEQEADRLLAGIENDSQLTLISAQRRRRGIGPQS